MLKKIILISIVFFLTCQSALCEAPNSFDYNMLDKLLADGNKKEAKKLLNQHISKNKQDFVAMIKLAEVFLTEGDKKSALKWLNSAIKINYTYPNAHLLRGKTYFYMNKFDDSAVEFSKYIELIGDPGIIPYQEKEATIRGLFSVFDISFSIKEYDVAKDALKKILEIDEKEAGAIYNLGVYYYKIKQNRSKAFELFSKVIKLDPSSDLSKKAKYAIEFMRTNPDPRVEPDFSFINSD